MSEPGGHLEISRAGLLRAPTGRLRPQEARDCLGRPRRPNSALPDFSSLCRGLGPAGEGKGSLHCLSGEGGNWLWGAGFFWGVGQGREKTFPGVWLPASFRMILKPQSRLPARSARSPSSFSIRFLGPIWEVTWPPATSPLRGAHTCVSLRTALPRYVPAAAAFPLGVPGSSTVRMVRISRVLPLPMFRERLHPTSHHLFG